MAVESRLALLKYMEPVPIPPPVPAMVVLKYPVVESIAMRVPCSLLKSREVN